MKKSLLLMTILTLCSCAGQANSSLSPSEPNSSGNPISSGEDLNLFFDKRVIGTWYIHQSNMALCNINDTLIINEDYTANFLNIEFTYAGIYDEFITTCLFLSPQRTVQLVVEFDDEDDSLNWGITDIDKTTDWGYARKEERISDANLNYSYEGESWPSTQINRFLSLQIELPVFVHNYYYLYTGTSSIYGDASDGTDQYCMIDLFDVDQNARENYVKQLEEASFVISKENTTFYQGYDPEKKVAIRLSQSLDSKNRENLCIFIYHYSVFYK